MLFFQQLPKDIIQECCDSATLRKLDHDQVLCVENTTDNFSFWIVLKGELQVFKRSIEKEEKHGGAEASKPRATRRRRGSVSFAGTSDVSGPGSKGRGHHGLCVGIIQSGNAVGEVSLLTRGPRTATVISNGESILMEMSTNAFDRCLRSISHQIHYQPGQTFEVIRRAYSHGHSMRGANKILRSLFQLIPSFRNEHIPEEHLKYFDALYVKNGEDVYAWREDSSKCFVLVKGCVKLHDKIRGKVLTYHRAPGTYLGATEMLLECTRMFDCIGHGSSGAFLLSIDRHGFEALHGDNQITTQLIDFITSRTILGEEADNRDLVATIEMFNIPAIHVTRGTNLMHKICPANKPTIGSGNKNSSSSSDEEDNHQSKEDFTLYFLLKGEISIVEKSMRKIQHRRGSAFGKKPTASSMALFQSPLRKRRVTMPSCISRLQSGSVFPIESRANEMNFMCTSESAIVTSLNTRKLKRFLRPSSFATLMAARENHSMFQHRQSEQIQTTYRQGIRNRSEIINNASSQCPVLPSPKKKPPRKPFRTTRLTGESAIEYANRIMEHMKNKV